METDQMTRTQEPPPPRERTRFSTRRFKLFGMDSDGLIKAFFGGNTTIAIIILVLITVFLLREGFGFFGENRRMLADYRSTGLEFADKMRAQVDEFYALTRYLTLIKTRQIDALEEREGLGWEAAQQRLQPLDDYSARVTDAIAPVQGIVDELKGLATKLRNDYKSNLNNLGTRARLEHEAEAARQAGNEALAREKTEAAAAVPVKDISFEKRRQPLMDALPRYIAASDELQANLRALSTQVPTLPTNATDEQVARYRELVQRFIAQQEQTEAELHSWDPDRPVPFMAEVTSFLFGRRWITNSYFQDWYGLVPLLAGSLLVSGIALAIGVPLGVAAAIYVSQVASPREQRIIKPYIEFISAIPSVVIGFFGVLVWGAFVREASGWAIFSWLPFAPVSERLNAFTAGCLLALMAIPTIFTLAEDALNNVPKQFKEASFAVGATRLQTAARIVVPTALSGIISAVLLGFGRVIGETMVVLLCAGNRIALPDPSEGLGVVFEPVHTMTGIVAQEMGEVVQGSIHYRALFLVGTALFFISLFINYMAQKIVRRYRIDAN